MNDMEANLGRLRALVGSAESGGAADSSDDADPSSALIEMYADDVKLRWQGTDWPWGGDMDGRDKLIACLQATARLFVEPLVFWESNLWILDDERLLWWWRSRSRTFNDESFSNSGVTILRFRDDKVCEHWEYTDTEYLADALRGWRDVVDPAVGVQLASWTRRAPDAGTRQ